MTERQYVYRNLTCNVAPNPWYVCGVELDAKGRPSGGGVLEWCYNKNDAEHRLAMMQEYPHQFKGLAFGRWPT